MHMDKLFSMGYLKRVDDEMYMVFSNGNDKVIFIKPLKEYRIIQSKKLDVTVSLQLHDAINTAIQEMGWNVGKEQNN